MLKKLEVASIPFSIGQLLPFYGTITRARGNGTVKLLEVYSETDDVIAEYNAKATDKALTRQELKLAGVTRLLFRGKADKFPIGSTIWGNVRIIKISASWRNHAFKTEFRVVWDAKSGKHVRREVPVRIQRYLSNVTSEGVWEVVPVNGKRVPLYEITFAILSKNDPSGPTYISRTVTAEDAVVEAEAAPVKRGTHAAVFAGILDDDGSDEGYVVPVATPAPAVDKAAILDDAVADAGDDATEEAAPVVAPKNGKR